MEANIARLNAHFSFFARSLLAKPSACRKTFGELEKAEPFRIYKYIQQRVRMGARRLFTAKWLISRAQIVSLRFLRSEIRKIFSKNWLGRLAGEQAPRPRACQKVFSKLSWRSNQPAEKASENSKRPNLFEFTTISGSVYGWGKTTFCGERAHSQSNNRFLAVFAPGNLKDF